MEQERREINLEKRRVSKLKRKSMLLTAIICLMFMLANTTLARTEIPENLIEEKFNSLNSAMLSAGTAPSVTITQKTGNVTIDWTDEISDEGSQMRLGWAIPGTYKWTAPAGVTQIKLVVAGAGGGGGGSLLANYYDERYDEYKNYQSNGGKGGRGAKKTYDIVSVNPGQEYTIKVGKGGAAGTSTTSGYYAQNSAKDGKKGGTSSFGSYSQQGGEGGKAAGINKAGAAGTSYSTDGPEGGDGGSFEEVYSVDDYGTYPSNPLPGSDGYVQVFYTKINEDAKYNVYQKKDNGTEALISGNSGVSGTQFTTVVRETGKPSAPQVTATKKKNGNDISVTKSEDTGNKYTYRVEQKDYGNQISGEVIIFVDMSESMKGYWSKFKSATGPIATIAKKMLAKNMKVAIGTLPRNGVHRLSDFITSESELPQAMGYLSKLYNAYSTPAIKDAIDVYAEKGETGNKNIIIFTDGNGSSCSESVIETMNNSCINLYLVLHERRDTKLCNYCKKSVHLPYRDNDIANAFEDIWLDIEENLGYNSAPKTITAKSGIKGYQYYISTSSNTNLTKLGNQPIVALNEIPTEISGEEHAIQYLHIRAVDNVGNVSDVTTTKLEIDPIITLTSNYERGQNYVPLSWEINDQRPGYSYRLYEKSELTGEWRTVSTKYNKQVRVLNVYPTGVGGYGDTDIASNTSITFKSEIDGKTYTLPKSASLKQWMEEANEEQPKGYGKGLIRVDAVSITDYNNNPSSYLKDSNGKYKYDVIMFGSWDNNGHEDLNSLSTEATQAVLNTGRGVLFGHDTAVLHSNFKHSNFAQLLKGSSGIDVLPVSGDTEGRGSSWVKVVRFGYITKYPYNIETSNLNIPYSHVNGQTPKDGTEIWLKYLDNDGNETQYDYLMTYNNYAMIQTGHSNCEATADEQKILANTLFYLGQVTEDTFADAYTAEDLAAPVVNASMAKISGDTSKVNLNVTAEDRGTIYEHYIIGKNDLATSSTLQYEQKTEEFTTPGTYTWTAPEGVTSVTATIAGAGGGMGGSIVHDPSTTNESGGGAITSVMITPGGNGGNGDKQEKIINVVPGQTYNIVVGKGGIMGRYSDWYDISVYGNNEEYNRRAGFVSN